MSILKGKQLGDFHAALMDAFPMPQRMEQVLKLRLGKNLYSIGYTGNINDDYYKLLVTAEAEDWTLELLNACREANPGNAALLAFSQQFALASTKVKDKQLTQIQKQALNPIGPVEWRERLGRLETQVCRVEVTPKGGSKSFSTGFLVGPDAVLTVWSVISAKGKLTAPVKPENILFRFDFKEVKSGVINEGTTYRLADDADWLVTYSPFSTADMAQFRDMEEFEASVTGTDELDFALLRLAEPAGILPVGELKDKEGSPRGWVTLPGRQIIPEPNDPLLILQHPTGGPLKLEIDTNAGTHINRSETRLRYHTPTVPGAGGSPCFTYNFELVAIHHAGFRDRNNPEAKKINQGIPIGLIREHLEKLNLLGVVFHPNLTSESARFPHLSAGSEPVGTELE